MIVKKLNGSGLNPRIDLTSKHVCEANLEVFRKVATCSKAPTISCMKTQEGSLLVCTLRYMGHQLSQTMSSCLGW